MKSTKRTALIIKNLYANVEGKEILHNVNMTVKGGEVHAVMGPNGSGKSTLASVLMGHPFYQAGTGKKRGTVQLGGKNVLNLPAEGRAKLGMYMAFQSPIAIAGVTVMNLLREAYQAVYGSGKTSKVSKYNPALVKQQKLGDMTIVEFVGKVNGFAKKLSLTESLLRRGINDGFSGGEKKKVEMLQALVLNPAFAIFDEIDTGLDVDALKAVAYGIEELRERGTGILIITHYQRILRYVKPDYVHVLVDGSIVKTGGWQLAEAIEKKGYSAFR